MTAAVNVDPRASNHPPGGAGPADPHTALRSLDSLPTPASPALQYFTASVIPVTVRQLPTRLFGKGDYLYHQGDSATYAHIVEEGLVALTLDAMHDRDRVVALAGPGDVVGALAPNLITYQESATALSGEVVVRLLSLAPGAAAPPAEFEALLAAAAGEQIVRLTHALEDSSHPVPARVAHTLLRLGDRFGQRMADGSIRLTLPVTHDTLAAMVGAARETTTSIVQQLRSQGLLEGTRGSYRFAPRALTDYAHQAAQAAR